MAQQYKDRTARLVLEAREKALVLVREPGVPLATVGKALEAIAELETALLLLEPRLDPKSPTRRQIWEIEDPIDRGLAEIVGVGR